MSYVFASPELIAAASGDLTGIGSAIREANAAAAGSTTQVVAAAQDEVSAAIARLFGGYGQEFQALSAQTALFHDRFVQALSSGGGLYAAAEAANAAALPATAVGDPLTELVDLAQPFGIFSPVKLIYGALAVRQRRQWDDRCYCGREWH